MLHLHDQIKKFVSVANCRKEKLAALKTLIFESHNIHTLSIHLMSVVQGKGEQSD